MATTPEVHHIYSYTYNSEHVFFGWSHLIFTFNKISIFNPLRKNKEFIGWINPTAIKVLHKYSHYFGILNNIFYKRSTSYWIYVSV